MSPTPVHFLLPAAPDGRWTIGRTLPSWTASPTSTTWVPRALVTTHSFASSTPCAPSTNCMRECFPPHGVGRCMHNGARMCFSLSDSWHESPIHMIRLCPSNASIDCRIDSKSLLSAMFCSDDTWHGTNGSPPMATWMSLHYEMACRNAKYRCCICV